MGLAVNDNQPNQTKEPFDLAEINEQLEHADAQEIIAWGHHQFGGGLAMSSSFGAQAAVMLHLATQVVPNISIIFIDTGYHFPETYRFADQLKEQLNLNLKVYQSPLSPAYMESRHGKLWEKGETDEQLLENLNKYDRIRKIEPMQRALRELNITAWLAGLRSQQTTHRATLPIVSLQNSLYKIHPILNWSQKQVYEYIRDNNLPTHPLYERGYKSIGDWHSTRAVGDHGRRKSRAVQRPQTRMWPAHSYNPRRRRITRRVHALTLT